MKKLILLTKALLMTAIVASNGLMASAYDFMADSICYNVIGDNEVEVTYKGPLYYSGRFYKGDVVVPATVEHDGVVYQVTQLGIYAFTNSPNLTSVTMPNGLKTIKKYSLSNCQLITQYDIPASVTLIEGGAFNGTGLERINVDSANECYSDLEGVLFDKQQTTIIHHPTKRDSTYIIPDGVTTIGSYAFYNNSKLIWVGIPEGVTTIEQGAFFNCSKLEDIEFPNSLVTIGEEAFRGCTSFTSVEITRNVAEIGFLAFFYCPNVTEFKVSRMSNHFCSVDGVLYSKDMTVIHYLAQGDKRTTYVIPNTVKIIENYCFTSSSLTSVTIPEGVTTICQGAFYGSRNLAEAHIPNTVQEIRNVAFCNCPRLKEINLPEGLTYIGEQAFCMCDSISEIIIPNTVHEIGDWAFRDCKLVKTIKISDSATSIGEMAFSGCKLVQSITVPGTVTYIGANAFSDCSALKKIIIGGPNDTTTTTIGVCPLINCDSLKYVEFGANVKNFEHGPLMGCKSLSRIVCHAAIPPVLVDDNSYSYNSHPRLYVHRASLEAYTSHVYWGRVPRIIPIESLGDINNDGFIDIDDVTKLVQGVLDGDSTLDVAYADVNYDDTIDIDDITALIRKVLTGQ